MAHRRKAHKSAPRKVHHGKKTKTRRRRRMGAGGGAFKALSDPIIGGIFGVIIGRAAKNVLKSVLPEQMKPYADGAVAVLAYTQRKKIPMVAAGAGGNAVVSLFVGMKKADGTPVVPFLAEVMEENDNVRFADERILAEEKNPLILSEQSYRIAPMNEYDVPVFAPYSFVNEDEDYN